jgi:hypothetical protein
VSVALGKEVVVDEEQPAINKMLIMAGQTEANKTLDFMRAPFLIIRFHS